MVTAGREKLLFCRLYFLPLIRGLVCGMSICEVELDVGYVGLLRHLLFFVTHITRSGKNFSSAWKVYRNPAGEDSENYPMIQVPNPKEGEEESDFMYVYRPWTAEDVRKATEDIPHPKVNVKGFEDGIKNLYESYRLNGLELERSLRNVMGVDWCVIRGDWSPIMTQGAVLQYDSRDQADRLEALLKRL